MIEKYGRNEAEKIIEYSYENSQDPTMEIIPPPPQTENVNKRLLNNIQQYNETIRNNNNNYKQPLIPPNINKFSPAYARIVGAKPKATASANIRLGGVYR
jgi:t-SNARE complex subunit (syntaxin)